MNHLEMSLVFLFAALICLLLVPAAKADEGEDEIPILSEIPGVGEGNDEAGPAIPLKLGEKKKLDHIGPLVINKDGTTKRVTNWDKMTPDERDAAYERIIARNRLRLKDLKDRLAKEAIEEQLSRKEL
eukprot:TRINITY_DN13461_c0_g1_i1.p1 TRINITY_DN13461_c0_g1~~TRINITY_DN13461_c0_g1_i1.p1  ORF type:complete len:144 (+),score=36.86 TRINITY_DN13461_c0_g1_i1:51-434(+)